MEAPLKIGDVYSLNLCIDDEIIHKYAEAVGDYNPLHLDDDFAASTPFKRRIAHGGILFGVISRILGIHFPGPGTVFLEQNIKFTGPIFPNDNIEFSVEVAELLPKNGCRLETRVRRGEDKIAAGYALVKLPVARIKQ